MNPGANQSQRSDFETNRLSALACESHRTVEIRRSPALRATCLRIVGFIHSFSTDSVETDLGGKRNSERAESRAVLQTKHKLEPRPDFVDSANLDVHQTLRQTKFPHYVIGKICFYA